MEVGYVNLLSLPVELEIWRQIFRSASAVELIPQFNRLPETRDRPLSFLQSTLPRGCYNFGARLDDTEAPRR